MKKLLLISSLLTFLFSCSTENKRVEHKKTMSILITNNQNTDSIVITPTGDLLKDVMLILDTLHFGYYNPKPLDLCYGKPNEVITDTSDYGEIEHIEFDSSLNKSSDSITIGGFYMDTHDYTIYEYNGDGLIKEYRFEASVRSDLYHQTKYYYSSKRLDSISTINQADYYREIIEGKEGELKNDGIYEIKIIYDSENQLSSITLNDLKKKKITLYNTVYSK